MSLFKSPNLIKTRAKKRVGFGGFRRSCLTRLVALVLMSYKTRAKKRVGFGGFRRSCLTRLVALVLMSYKTRTINYGFLNEGS